MRGRINIDISFPIISIFKDGENSDVYVAQTVQAYTVGKKSYTNKPSGLFEIIIDSNGVLYKKNSAQPLGYINIFRGFSLKSAGFGVCYFDVELEEISVLSIQELKHYGFEILEINSSFYEGTMLPIEKWRVEFERLTSREDVLRYMYYFAGTSYYKYPDNEDHTWRERKGFIKND